MANQDAIIAGEGGRQMVADGVLAPDEYQLTILALTKKTERCRNDDTGPMVAAHCIQRKGLSSSQIDIS
jgi:hypothetical protein